MILTADNYYSCEADREYMSVSQFKSFAGTFGKSACEFAALEKLNRRWEEEKTTPLLVGGYVDAYFEGSLEKYKEENPEIFTRSGDLRSEFKHAETIIKRIERDRYFMKYMSGQKQVIMTGELFGAKWKIKMDSYIPDVAIVDLKVVKAINGKEAFDWVKDYGYTYFALVWGYDIQGAIYQEIVRQNTGKKLPFYLACASKQKPEPDIDVKEITDNYLQSALSWVQNNMERVLKVKNGEVNPIRCERCDCCRHTKVLTRPSPIPDMPDAF